MNSAQRLSDIQITDMSDEPYRQSRSLFKVGVFTSKMMLEKINCNSILFIGEDIINIIHEYVH